MATKVRWTADEDAVLRGRYVAGAPLWDGWESDLPGRTEAGVRARAKKLGISHAANPRWSEADDDALREYYPSCGPAWAGWADVLEVSREPDSIRRHYYKLRECGMAGDEHVTGAGGHWATCACDAVVMDDAARGRLRRAYMAGVPLELLAERFGRKPDALREILRRDRVVC